MDPQRKKDSTTAEQMQATLRASNDRQQKFRGRRMGLVTFGFSAAVTVLASLAAGDARAYEVHTHSLVSFYAASRSVIHADPGLFSDWGYGDPALETFTTSDAPTGTARELIGRGALLEDDLEVIKRVFNHFYDPQFNNYQGRGLDSFLGQGVGHPSPTWALEDTGDVVSLAAILSPAGVPQQFSFREAQHSFLHSLTLAAAQDRRAATGRMFRTLGHVIHHVQDMAQPQHVRNDTHSPVDDPAKSFFERYTERVIIDAIPSILTNNPMGIPSFPTARLFWTEGAPAYRGMADFTAHNYVSYGTGFRTYVQNGVEKIAPNSSSLPLPSGLNVDLSEKTIATRTLPIRQLNGSVTNEAMDYVVGNIFDGAYGSGITYPNKLLASASLLDKPLASAGHSRIFSVNQAVFDDNYSILLPRAEAFSAGLINHFFRGRLGFSRSGSTTTWIIQNRSTQPMTGNFRVYMETSSGTRAPLSGGGPFTATVAPSASTSVVLSEPPSGTQRLIVVFQGKIGEEPASLADPNWFAVAGKVINYTPPPVPCGGNLKGSGGIEGLDTTVEMGNTAGNVQLSFEAYSVKDSLVVTAVNSANTQLASTGGMISGLYTKTYNFDPSALGTTKARVRITGSENGTAWNVAMSCPGKPLASGDFPPSRSVTFRFGSALSGARGSCQADFYVDGVRVGLAYISANGTTSLTKSLTQGPQHGAEFRNFGCTSDQWNLGVGAEYIDGGGAVRLQNMNQAGIRLFDVR